jgi:DNA-binding MarR family transcriptional regulator
MGSGEIDRIQVSQLMARYDLARSAVYTRMTALGITPIKIGNKAFINAEQLRQLDDLHLHIQGGGNTAEFQEMRGYRRKKESQDESTGLTAGQGDILGMFNRMLGMFQPTPPDPLDYYEKLEQAYRNGWELKTSEIADLLDIPPSEIKQYGDRFQEAGFVFLRSGSRWRVLKR